MNSFLFVCFRGCKNSSPAFPLAYKSTAAVAFALQNNTTRLGVANSLQSLRGGFVSVVSAVCLVHFLTFVSNYSSNSNIVSVC